jgi:molybdopterin converting factor small subunit
MPLDSVFMQAKVLAFGPIAEEMGGREHLVDILPNSSVRFVLEELGLDMWLSQGLMVSINGNKVSEDEPVSDGDEIALLPPVSGG